MSPRLADRTDCEPVVAIEVLITGQLPVRAAPWAGQYARVRAADIGAPVSLVRLMTGHASIEVFGADAEAFTGVAGDTFENVLARLHDSGIAGFLVLTDELSAAGLARDDRVDAVTVLAGADEAAMVAAYGIFKGLSGTGADQSPRLQIAIMGAAAEAARPSVDRLNSAATSFLGRPVMCSAVVEKVEPSGSVVLFQGECGIDAAKVVALLAAPSETAAAARGEAPIPELVSQVEGMTALDLTCPWFPDVQFALGARRSLHIMSLAEPGVGLESLLGAGVWARQHMSLITRALGEDAPDASHDPVLHLFCTDPKQIRSLQGTEIRLHLMMRSREAWSSIQWI